MRHINLESREFRENIIRFCNQSPLPVEVKRLNIWEIYSQLNLAAENSIKSEIAEEEAENPENNSTPSKKTG